MVKIIALFNNKGGVSKTTTTFHLGWKLADMGYKTLIVDTVVCIPSSRQLKKYKIFVLPGWISGNIFMPPIVAFHEIPLVLRLQVLSVAGRLYSNLYIL